MTSNIPWCVLALWLCGQFTATDQSITGITYRDNFNFEERYSKDYECDPMRWYPLHLPDKCVEKHAKLIRSRIAAQDPYKVIRDKESAERRKQDMRGEKYLYDVLDMSSLVPDQDMYEYEPDKLVLQEMGYLAQEPDDEKVKFPSWFPPHLLMVEKIRQDVRELAALPVLGYLPNIGLAAIYQQPVSDDTKDTINDIATKYGTAVNKFYEELKVYPIPLFIDKIKNCTKTTTEEPKTKDEKDEKSKELDENSEDPDKNMHDELLNEKHLVNDDITSTTKDPNRQVVRKKIEVGNLVAYIEQKKVIGKNYGKLKNGKESTDEEENKYTGIVIEAET